jgi:hypothetical protein
LPFTGAAVPVKTATVVGAGLVVTGAAVVMAARKRTTPATVTAAAAAPVAVPASEVADE